MQLLTEHIQEGGPYTLLRWTHNNLKTLMRFVSQTRFINQECLKQREFSFSLIYRILFGRENMWHTLVLH